MAHENLIMPFWHFNVLPNERTVECPDYLQNLSEKDKSLIGKWDADYEYLSWQEVRQIVGEQFP